MIQFFRQRLELLVWVGGLLVLAFMNPEEPHLTLCPLSNLGIEFCPGCGLGRSISYLFRLEIAASWQQHPLGIFAIIVLFTRIKKLLAQPFP